MVQYIVCGTQLAAVGTANAARDRGCYSEILNAGEGIWMVSVMSAAPFDVMDAAPAPAPTTAKAMPIAALEAPTHQTIGLTAWKR